MKNNVEEAKKCDLSIRLVDPIEKRKTKKRRNKDFLKIFLKKFKSGM